MEIIKTTTISPMKNKISILNPQALFSAFLILTFYIMMAVVIIFFRKNNDNEYQNRLVVLKCEKFINHFSL